MKMSSMNYNIKEELVYLPTPINIDLLWNFGFLLGCCLMIQIVSGLFLSMHYCSSMDLAFNSVIHIMHDVKYGWELRLIHMNGASLFFICLFLHIGRGVYINSYNLIYTWVSGSIIFIMVMGTAFLGYVLPWGQMSFWGATVITNLVSAIPFLGGDIVIWLWGGYSVSGATLARFYSFHFILPFMILLLVLVHLVSLHFFGSSNPLGAKSDLNKVPFHNYFTIKDFLIFFYMMLVLFLLSCLFPYILGDPENFSVANFMVTPVHIQPEWYFLFAYAILRSIPNKLGGVVALGMSVFIIMFLPFMVSSSLQGNFSYPLNQVLYWGFVNILILLTWIGMKPIEEPFMMIGQILTFMYFIYYLFNIYIMKMWDLMML